MPGASGRTELTRSSLETGYSGPYLRDQRGQPPHVVKDLDCARMQERRRMAGTAVAAARKAEHGHAGGSGTGNPGDAVLDDEASFRPRAHPFGSEQEQIGCGLATIDV